MAHRKWKETKLQTGTAGPGNSCFVFFYFLWAILCPQAVLCATAYNMQPPRPRPAIARFGSEWQKPFDQKRHLANGGGEE